MIKEKVRILLAEGDPAETTAALRELYPEAQDGLELTIVSTIATLIATLEIVNPEVIFVDLSLAHPDPLEAVRRVHRSAPEVPLIVLADSSDKNCATQSLSQGALDYLLKGFIDTRTLERVLREALAHNTLEGLADLLRDPLTGLYIRDGFLTLGKRAMETAKRRKSTLVLLCMRIDNLAALLGHGLIAVESSCFSQRSVPFPFLPLTRTFRGATNRRKTRSLVVSLLTNCRAQCASEAAEGLVMQHPTHPGR